MTFNSGTKLWTLVGPAHMVPVQSVTDQYALMAGSSAAVTQPDTFIDLPDHIRSRTSTQQLSCSLTSLCWALIGGLQQDRKVEQEENITVALSAFKDIPKCVCLCVCV